MSVAGGGKVVATASLTLWGVLAAAYERLGFEVLGDEAFRSLVLARVVEPTSKADTARVLADIGVPAPSLRTIFRALGRTIGRDYRDRLAKACLAHSARTSGPAALVLYDCTTLLCRCRHNRVYADLLVMPMLEVSAQVRASLVA